MIEKLKEKWWNVLVIVIAMTVFGHSLWVHTRIDGGLSFIFFDAIIAYMLISVAARELLSDRRKGIFSVCSELILLLALLAYFLFIPQPDPPNWLFTYATTGAAGLVFVVRGLLDIRNDKNERS